MKRKSREASLDSVERETSLPYTDSIVTTSEDIQNWHEEARSFGTWARGVWQRVKQHRNKEAPRMQRQELRDEALDRWSAASRYIQYALASTEYLTSRYPSMSGKTASQSKQKRYLYNQSGVKIVETARGTVYVDASEEQLNALLPNQKFDPTSSYQIGFYVGFAPQSSRGKKPKAAPSAPYISRGEDYDSIGIEIWDLDKDKKTQHEFDIGERYTQTQKETLAEVALAVWDEAYRLKRDGIDL